MKLSKTLIVASLVVVLGIEVRAETVTISQTNSFANLTTGTQTLSFNLIGSAFGSSVAESDIVNLSVFANINLSYGFFVVENLGSDRNVVNFSTFTKYWLTSSHLPDIFPNTEDVPDGMFEFSTPVTLESFEKLSGNFGFFDEEIVDSFTLGGDFSGSNMVGLFLGSGTFDIVVNAIGSHSIEGMNIDKSILSTPQLSGNVVLTYEIVPEPSTASLLVLGLGGLIALRRTRRSRE